MRTAQGDSETVRTAVHIESCAPQFSPSHCLPAPFSLSRCTFSRMINTRELVALVVLVPFSAKSQVQPQKPDSAPPIVQDNSFLMEEAYNQEKGIVQHINTFRTHRGSSDFDYSFTQEWPVGGLSNQLSYDLPVVRAARETGIGDV